MGQPRWVQTMVLWTASIISAHPLAAGLGVGIVQIALGIGIIFGPTRRAALLCSIPWALGVWAFGEGFGNLLTGFSMLPSGSPGPALLYALAAVALFPRRRDGSTTTLRAALGCGALGERGAAVAWGTLWVGAALQQVVPFITLGFKLSANFQMASLGEPLALSRIDRATARFAGGNGVELSTALVAFELIVAAAGLFHGGGRSWLLVLPLASFPLLWVVGENLGGLLTGSGTDLGSMPLYALLAVGLLPLRPRSLQPGLLAGRQCMLDQSGSAASRSTMRSWKLRRTSAASRSEITLLKG